MPLDPDIATLNLEPIAFKVCMDEGWSVSEVDAIELEYRAFLQAHRNNPDMFLVPSRKIDKFWHHHILDTEKYIADCELLFGKYMHHYPYSGLLDLDDAAQQAKRYAATRQILAPINP